MFHDLVWVECRRKLQKRDDSRQEVGNHVDGLEITWTDEYDVDRWVYIKLDLWSQSFAMSEYSAHVSFARHGSQWIPWEVTFYDVLTETVHSVVPSLDSLLYFSHADVAYNMEALDRFPRWEEYPERAFVVPLWMMENYLRDEIYPNVLNGGRVSSFDPATADYLGKLFPIVSIPELSPEDCDVMLEVILVENSVGESTGENAVVENHVEIPRRVSPPRRCKRSA